MTSEVCLMNRRAIVLAADSATTVTQWSEKGREERYFKGANKIFQLSNHHPVGLMIFDSADILRVPWEIIAKEFRKHLGAKSFNKLENYAQEFFDFLNNGSHFFPDHVQKEVFLSSARTAALGVLFSLGAMEGLDAAEKERHANAAVAARRAELDAAPLAPCIEPDAPTATIAAWRDDLVAMLEDLRIPLGLTYPTDLASFAELGMLEIFKFPQHHLGTTGLVFAGFGDHEIFPAMIEYSSCGMVAGKHVSREVSRVAIDHEMPAWLSAFAQTSMSDTFSLGISEDVYASITLALIEGLEKFAEEVAQESGGDINRIANLQLLLEKARSGISDAILGRARQQHALPLRRVLGVLPVDEMAELAETLINLQSLKEKVTKPSETVGGPVDVAVITKGEGLVWIKRKHFFDLNLNSRFLQRQATTYK